MKSKVERWIAITVIASALLLTAALSVAMGKISFGASERQIRVRFESITGINHNSTVKLAGANVGRVAEIRVLPRKEQTLNAKNKLECVELVLDIDSSLELGSDLQVSIKQDGLLGAKFIALTPGSPESPLLANNVVLSGEGLVDIGQLAGSGSELLAKLTPALERINSITAHVDDSLPGLLAKIDSVLANGDALLATVSGPEEKDRIKKMLANLKVVSDNLKVISTNAKAMTKTLGERPWRLLFGGAPNALPSEESILKSDKPIPVQTSEHVEPKKK